MNLLSIVPYIVVSQYNRGTSSAGSPNTIISAIVLALIISALVVLFVVYVMPYMLNDKDDTYTPTKIKWDRHK